MDLVATLRSKIDNLREGDHTAGLQAVLSHIEVAFRHLMRGQSKNDESAFTDVIYRCNQAFEGSIKEAYRVLTGKDPHRKSPFEIEVYLDSNNVFRDRVLAQFTNYRTEWRNPSAHDYKLDFDESESFLAIVSVSAFACVLIDQVAVKFAQEDGAKEAKQDIGLKQGIDINKLSLMDLATELFVRFSRAHHSDLSIHNEFQLLGSITGFFNTLVPALDIASDYRISPNSRKFVDLFLKHDNEKVLVELKRANNPRIQKMGIRQLLDYMSLTEINDGILFMYPSENKELTREEYVNVTNKVARKILILR